MTRKEQALAAPSRRQAIGWTVAIAALVAAGFVLFPRTQQPVVAGPETRVALEEMQRLFEAGRFADMRSLGEAHLEAFSDAPGVHYLLGLAAEAEGEDEAAIVHFTEEERRSPGHVPSHLKAAAALTRSGQRDDAITGLDRAYDATEHNREVALALGRLLAQSDSVRARSLLQETLDESPVEAGFELGLLARRANDLDVAERHFRVVIEHDPSHLGAIFNLGQCLLQRGRQAEGERLLVRHAELQKEQDQLDVLERAARLGWSEAINLVHLGRYQMLQGDLEAAMASLAEALRREPGNAEAATAMARARMERQEYDQAAELLEELVGRVADSAEGHFLLGITHHNRGDFEAARSSLGRSRELEEWGADEYLFLGNAFFGSADIADARLAWEEAVRLDPELADGHYKLALLAYQNARLEDCIVLLKRYGELEPNDVRGRILEGIARFRLGDVAGAELAYGRALDRVAVIAPTTEDADRVMAGFSTLPEAGPALAHLAEMRRR